MAELTMGKGVSAGKIASNVQKKITRAQEKVRTTAICLSLNCYYRMNVLSVFVSTVRVNNQYRVLIILLWWQKCVPVCANILLLMPLFMQYDFKKALLIVSDDWRIQWVSRTQACNKALDLWVEVSSVCDTAVSCVQHPAGQLPLSMGHRAHSSVT